MRPNSISARRPGPAAVGALVLKGEARPLIALQPAGVYFGSIYGEKAHTQTVAITNNGETPLKLVLDPLASTGGWTFDLTEKDAGRTFELTAKFDPKGLKPGYVRQTALLLSNIQAQHQIQVQATAAVRDRIEAEPATLTIYAPTTQPAYAQAAMAGVTSRPAAATQPAAFPRTIRVQNYGETPVKVTGNVETRVGEV